MLAILKALIVGAIFYILVDLLLPVLIPGLMTIVYLSYSTKIGNPAAFARK